MAHWNYPTVTFLLGMKWLAGILLAIDR